MPKLLQVELVVLVHGLAQVGILVEDDLVAWVAAFAQNETHVRQCLLGLCLQLPVQRCKGIIPGHRLLQYSHHQKFILTGTAQLFLEPLDISDLLAAFELVATQQDHEVFHSGVLFTCPRLPIPFRVLFLHGWGSALLPHLVEQLRGLLHTLSGAVLLLRTQMLAERVQALLQVKLICGAQLMVRGLHNSRYSR